MKSFLRAHARSSTSRHPPSCPRRSACPHALYLANASTRNGGRAFSRSAAPRSAEAWLSGDLKFGQPLHESHPHLIKSGELTPGITALEYFERRMRLAKAMPPDSVAILAASDVKTRSGAVFFKFHQEPSFFYLTGFNEPEAVAVIQKRGSGTDHVFYLFVRPKDPAKEKWEGSRSGIEAAREIFNADAAADITALTTRLPRILSDATNVYTDIPTRNSESSSPIAKMIFGGAAPSIRLFSELLANSNIAPLRPIINNLRAYKSPAEIANLRAAGQKSGRGFTNAMSQKWESELQLEGFLEYQFKYLGCEQSAYVPVIAGGENANQIHYVRNDATLRDGQLICADAGGEYGGYVADITRTWPVSGKFSPPQRDLYEMILDVQRRCVSMCRADAKMSLDQLHHFSDRELRKGLESLGFDLSRGVSLVFCIHSRGMS